MKQDILVKRRNIEGKCEYRARIVLAYDGERIFENCGRVIWKNPSKEITRRYPFAL